MLDIVANTPDDIDSFLIRMSLGEFETSYLALLHLQHPPVNLIQSTPL